MGLSEEQEGAEEAHGLPHILKLRSSPVFEILVKKLEPATRVLGFLS